MDLELYPRAQLAFLPTPIQELHRLTQILAGPRILIKRDDQTGLALGGNKTRKLEYLLGEAIQSDIDTIITAGAMQSNHCRQTAAAAAQMGLRCELLLRGSPVHFFEGNLLLNNLLGAHIHWQDNKDEPNSLEELAKNVLARGYKPYTIPYGGSNAFGALGYVNAMKELKEQLELLKSPSPHVIFASCSGATHVGLVVGAELIKFSGKIMGISVDFDVQHQVQFQDQLVDLANETASKILVNKQYSSEDFDVNYDYAKGYGIVGELERNAIHLLAKNEGILLDPVYSGRAFGALIDMIKKGRFTKNDTILFWHTGGTPVLFPYASDLVT